MTDPAPDSPEARRSRSRRRAAAAVVGGILGWLFFRWILPVGCEPRCGPRYVMTDGAAMLGIVRNVVAFVFGAAVLAAGIREPDA